MIRRKQANEKINNLKELEELVGRETVKKCFTEYMMMTIAKAEQWEQAHGEGASSDTDLFEDED